MDFREINKAWLPVLLWMALMYFGSTDAMSSGHTSRFLTPFLLWWDPAISPTAIARVHLVVRKAAHLTEYAILAGLIYRAFRGWAGEFWRRAALILALAIIFALADEFHQSFIASRTASLGDVLLDGSGAFIGWMICATTWKRQST